jgi:hypothetical protein
VLSTDQKGAIAEAAIAYTAIKLGIDVYKPLSDGTRYDLIFDTGRELVRVQCKWATRYDDVIIVRCYSCRRSRLGMIKRGYTPDEVDAFAAYCADTDRCYFLPIDAFPGQTGVQLRLGPTRNNQRRGIHWAEAYEFDATLAQFGAVAQLGERLPGRQKATGSSPVGST